MFTQTPLILAITREESDLAVDLISQGVDLDGRDWSGTTALMHSVWVCREDICRLLIDAGANVNAKTNKGRTALDIAYMVEARRPSDQSKQIIQYLLAQGAKRNDLNAK